MDAAPNAEQLHALEVEFGLSAREVLDVINNRNRCKIAVRGAIAEAHLVRLLRELRARGHIEAFEDFDRDGYPDCSVAYRGRSFLVECKNVRKRTQGPISIDFQRTRNPIDRKWERYYLPTEFDVVAACLWNRTSQWDFLFAATIDLPRHAAYPERITTRVVVDTRPVPGSVWSRRLLDVLDRLLLTPPRETAAEAT
jgi:hypothetical protein